MSHDATTPNKINVTAEHAERFLNGFVDQWAKARIDGPLQLVSRLDDTSKQLITVSGVLQAILIAVAKLGDEHRPLSTDAMAAFVFLLLTIALAAIALVIQSNYLKVHGFYKMLSRPTDADVVAKLDKEIHGWCKSYANVTRWKRGVLALAVLSLIVGLSFSVRCVAEAMKESSIHAPPGTVANPAPSSNIAPRRP